MSSIILNAYKAVHLKYTLHVDVSHHNGTISAQPPTNALGSTLYIYLIAVKYMEKFYTAVKIQQNVFKKLHYTESEFNR